MLFLACRAERDCKTGVLSDSVEQIKLSDWPLTDYKAADTSQATDKFYHHLHTWLEKHFMGLHPS